MHAAFYTTGTGPAPLDANRSDNEQNMAQDLQTDIF